MHWPGRQEYASALCIAAFLYAPARIPTNPIHVLAWMRMVGYYPCIGVDGQGVLFRDLLVVPKKIGVNVSFITRWTAEA